MGVVRHWGRVNSVGFLVVALLISIAVSDVSAQFDRSSFRKRLTEKAEFTPDDLDALEAGQTVVKTIKTGDKQETAVIGVVKAPLNGIVTLDRFRASLSQKRTREIGPGAKFSSPPNIGDLGSLDLEEKDVEQLKNCVVGKCDLNMTEKMIDRMNSAIDPSATDHSQLVNEAYRALLADFAAAYEARGIAMLEPLVNRRKTVAIGQDHRSLLNNSLFLREATPKLYSFLQDFPKGDRDVTSDLYWSTIEFGLKPMITISHVAAYVETNEKDERFAIATRQIYASRYLDSSLALAFLFRFTDGSNSDAYLVFTDRTRSDALGGLLGGVARSVVEQEGKERVKKIVERSRDQLAASPATAQDGPEQPEAGTASGSSAKRTVILIGVSAALILAIGVWLIKRNRAIR